MTTLTTPPPTLPDRDVAAERVAEAAQWDRDAAWAAATMQERFAADMPAAAFAVRDGHYTDPGRYFTQVLAEDDGEYLLHLHPATQRVTLAAGCSVCGQALDSGDLRTLAQVRRLWSRWTAEGMLCGRHWFSKGTEAE